ncbi:MAG: hypothetical protein IJG17_01585, partial [Eubacterium sp.]|nr:hypothetical protein [Eubacterium sp.]
ELFQKIIELFPDTRRAESAEYYIQELGGSAGSAETDAAGTGTSEGQNPAGADENPESSGEYEEDTAAEEYQNEGYQEEDYQEQENWDNGEDENTDWE